MHRFTTATARCTDPPSSMPVVSRQFRSILDYDTEDALRKAMERVCVGISDCSLSRDALTKALLQSNNRNNGPTAATGNEDWILPNAVDPQPTVEQEVQRLRVLHSFNMLDSNKEAAFDALTEKARAHYGVPWACVSFVDIGRVWIKSATNLTTTETSRRGAFCSHAILRDGITQVGDTLQDERFRDTPTVVGQPGIRFYAGVPLSIQGHKIGSFFIMDKEPRPNGLTVQEKDKLIQFAHETVQLMLQRRANELKQQEQQSLRKRSSEDSLEAPKRTSGFQETQLLARSGNKSRRVQDDTTSARTSMLPGSSSNTIIQRPPPTNKLLPDPKTQNVDPDVYLVQLVEALYGVTLKIKKALDLQDYFQTITEEQMAAYNMQVVSITRDDNLAELKEFHRLNGRQGLDCFNRFGEGLLNMTCRRGMKEIVQFLLSPPVSLNVRVIDDYGRSPMHDTCWNPEPQLEICTWICQQEPSLFLVADKRGYTPFQYARKSDWCVWREFLYEHRDLLEGLTRPEILSRFS